MTTNNTTVTQQSGLSITLYHVAIVILIAAIGVSGYLSYLKLDTNQDAVCIASGTFDCGTVLNSAYSEMMGIPIAWLGLGTNFVMLGLLILEKQSGFFEVNAPALAFGVVLFAFLFSVYLVYVQAAIIKAYCPWCLSHEALITVLFIVMGFRLRNAMQVEYVDADDV